MKVTLNKASDRKWSDKREINTLAELIDLMREFGEDIIASLDSIDLDDGDDMLVTIYDDWVE